MSDCFWPGFVMGAITTGFIAFLVLCIVSKETGSSVMATGYWQPRVHRVYVGDNLWVSDFTYDVSPSNALVTVKFAPKNEVAK